MKSLDLIARMRPTEEFVEAAEGVDVTAPLSDGTSLLLAAVGNSNEESRYATARWLLDHGCRPGAPRSEGTNELHVLFGKNPKDIDATASLARELLELGADINAMSPKFGVPMCELLGIKRTDEELEPLYDVWFGQEVVLDLVTPSATGRTPLNMAQALPYRAAVLERIERYLEEHPQ